MDVDTTAAKGRTSPISEPATSPSATSALQEVAANLASVKSAIKSGVADRNQVIDMLTNLLRETLQVGVFLALNAFLTSPALSCSIAVKHMALRQFVDIDHALPCKAGSHNAWQACASRLSKRHLTAEL